MKGIYLIALVLVLASCSIRLSTQGPAMLTYCETAGAGMTASVLAAGVEHTCAATGSSAACWGDNEFGQLGNGSTGSNATSPVAVQGLSGSVTAIAAGDGHSCAIAGGAIYCWGRNDSGQLGTGDYNDRSTATLVPGLPGTVSAIALGYYHTCAVVDGTAWCWGASTYGQLGDNSLTPSNLPTQVTGLGSGVTAIAAGAYFTCAIQNGSVQCWGANDQGQLGPGFTSAKALVPTAVTGLPSGLTGLSLGTGHACAWGSSGLDCWGRNAEGELGDGTNQNASGIVSVSGFSGVPVLAALGAYDTCALVGEPQASDSPTGSAFCWGSNGGGQLGDGQGADSYSPVAVSLPGTATALAGGAFHACAIVGNAETGTVYCWGTNDSGQLGVNSTSASSVPEAVCPVASL